VGLERSGRLTPELGCAANRVLAAVPYLCHLEGIGFTQFCFFSLHKFDENLIEPDALG